MDARIARLVLATVACTACHTYRPVETAPPGATVRAHVPVISALSAQERSEAVEGRVVLAEDSLVLETTSVRTYGAFREVVLTDTLRLARAELVGLELRSFSTGRSIALGTALALGAGGAILAAWKYGGGGKEPGGGGGGGELPFAPAPRRISLPLLLLRLPGL